MGSAGASVGVVSLFSLRANAETLQRGAHVCKIRAVFEKSFLLLMGITSADCTRGVWIVVSVVIRTKNKGLFVFFLKQTA